MPSNDVTSKSEAEPATGADCTGWRAETVHAGRVYEPPGTDAVVLGFVVLALGWLVGVALLAPALEHAAASMLAASIATSDLLDAIDDTGSP